MSTIDYQWFIDGSNTGPGISLGMTCELNKFA